MRVRWRQTVLFCGLPLVWSLIQPGSAPAQEFEDLFESVEVPWLSDRENRETAGDEEPLETDRDSFTPSTSTVEKGRVIFESAYSNIDNRDGDATHSYPEIVTRIGVFDRTELRIGWNYEIGGGGTVSGGDSGGLIEELGSEDESQMMYGFKTLVSEQDGWTPQSSVLVHGTTPTSGRETATDFQLGYVFGWKLFGDCLFDTAIRYVSTVEEHDHFNYWAPSVVLKVPVAERWNVHAEYFGTVTDGRALEEDPQYFSPGFHYLVTPDLEVGVRVGWGLNEDASNFFTNVGFGVRF